MQLMKALQPMSENRKKKEREKGINIHLVCQILSIIEYFF